MIIKAAKRIFNSDKICRSYSDLNFGVTFFGTQCILRSAAAVGESPRSATSAMMTSCVEFRQHDATQYFRISVYINLYWALAATVPVTDDLWPLTPACLTAKRTISDADRIQSGQSSVKFCPAPSLPTVVPDSSTPFRLFHAHLI